jgi:histidinol-phosphate aminotransferase
MNALWSPGISELKPYIPGEQPKVEGLLKLNSNEHPYGPSPKAQAAMVAAVGDPLRLYPDASATALRQAVAKQYGIQADQVFIGNGSDEVLAHAFYAFFRRPGPLLLPDISYSFYPVYCGLYGITVKRIALDEHFLINPSHYMGEASLGATGIIFPNPNAPTGQALSRAQIKTIVQANPHCVVIVDEAYVDFGAETAAPLINEFPNLLVVHTLSKSRAFAGMRVGYAMGQSGLIDALVRVKDSFNSYPLDHLAQVGAVAAIEDQAYFDWATQQVVQAREQLTQHLKTLGFEVLPSKTNFVFARHHTIKGAELTEKLRAHRILIRNFNLPRISEFVRITVGTFDECKRLINCIALILEVDSPQNNLN